MCRYKCSHRQYFGRLSVKKCECRQNWTTFLCKYPFLFQEIFPTENWLQNLCSNSFLSNLSRKSLQASQIFQKFPDCVWQILLFIGLLYTDVEFNKAEHLLGDRQNLECAKYQSWLRSLYISCLDLEHKKLILRFASSVSRLLFLRKKNRNKLSYIFAPIFRV